MNSVFFNIKDINIKHKSFQVSIFIIFFLSLYSLLSILGYRFYEYNVPFYDSLSYQRQYVQIVVMPKGLNLNNWNNVLSTTSLLPRLFAYVFAYLIPNPILGLYILLYGLQILSLFIIFICSYKLGNSWIIAWLSAFMIFGYTATFTFWGGILDQRLDFTCGLLYLASLMTLTSTLERKTSPLLPLSLLLLLFSIRPINSLMFATALITAVPLCVRHIVTKNDKLKHLGKYFLVLLIGLTLLGIIFKEYIFQIVKYYTQDNVDVAKQSYFSTIRFVLVGVVELTGIPLMILHFISTTTLFVLRKYRVLVSVFLMVVFTALPIIIARVGDNQFVLFPVFMSLIIFDILFLLALPLRLRYIALAMLMLILTMNIYTHKGLIWKVNFQNSERKELNKVEKIILSKLKNKDEKIIIGGFSPVSGSLVAINQHFGNNRFVYGMQPSHITEFDMPRGPASTPLSTEQLHALSITTDRVCNTSDVLITFDEQYIDKPDHYLFSFRVYSIIRQILKQSGCLNRKVASFTYEGNGYDVFTTKHSVMKSQIEE